MKAAPFQGRIRTMSDLKDFLEANFPPSCIGKEESITDAHRRAGEVGLAQRIIATIQASENQLED